MPKEEKNSQPRKELHALLKLGARGYHKPLEIVTQFLGGTETPVLISALREEFESKLIALSNEFKEFKLFPLPIAADKSKTPASQFCQVIDLAPTVNQSEVKDSGQNQQFSDILPTLKKINGIKKKITELYRLLKEKGDTEEVLKQKQRLKTITAQLMTYEPIISNMTRLFHEECARRLTILENFVEQLRLDSYGEEKIIANNLCGRFSDIIQELSKQYGEQFVSKTTGYGTIRTVTEILNCNKTLKQFFEKKPENGEQVIQTNIARAKKWHLQSYRIQPENSEDSYWTRDYDTSIPITDQLLDLWELHLKLLSTIRLEDLQINYSSYGIIPLYCEYDREKARHVVLKLLQTSAYTRRAWDNIFKFLQYGVILSENDFYHLVEKWIERNNTINPVDFYDPSRFSTDPLDACPKHKDFKECNDDCRIKTHFFSPVTKSEIMREYFKSEKTKDLVKKMFEKGFFTTATYFIQNGTPISMTEIATLLKKLLCLNEIKSCDYRNLYSIDTRSVFPFYNQLFFLFQQFPRLLSEFTSEDHNKIFVIAIREYWMDNSATNHSLIKFLIENGVALENEYLNRDHPILDELTRIHDIESCKAVLKRPDCDPRWISHPMRDAIQRRICGVFDQQRWDAVLAQFREICLKDRKLAARWATTIVSLSYPYDLNEPHVQVDLLDLINADPSEDKSWVNHIFESDGVENCYLAEVIRSDLKSDQYSFATTDALIQVLMKHYEDRQPFLRIIHCGEHKESRTPLHFLIQCGTQYCQRTSIFQRLLEEKISDAWLEREAKHQDNLLRQLIEDGNLECLKILFLRKRGIPSSLLNVKINVGDKEKSLLSLALQKIYDNITCSFLEPKRKNFEAEKYGEIAQLLIQQGIDFDSEDFKMILELEDDYSESQWVKSYVKRKSFPKLIVELMGSLGESKACENARKKAREFLSQLPLLLTTRSPCATMFLLNEKEPDELFSCRDSAGNTILHAALQVKPRIFMFSKIEKILKKLIPMPLKGIVNVKNNAGDTLLSLALMQAYNFQGDNISFSDLQKTISKLIEEGADGGILQWILEAALYRRFSYLNILYGCEFGKKLMDEQLSYHLGFALINNKPDHINLLLNFVNPRTLSSEIYTKAQALSETKEIKNHLDVALQTYCKQRLKMPRQIMALLRDLPCEKSYHPKTWDRDYPITKNRINVLANKWHDMLDDNECRNLIAAEIAEYTLWASSLPQEKSKEYDQAYLARLIYICKVVIKPSTPTATPVQSTPEAPSSSEKKDEPSTNPSLRP